MKIKLIKTSADLQREIEREIVKKNMFSDFPDLIGAWVDRSGEALGITKPRIWLCNRRFLPCTLHICYIIDFFSYHRDAWKDSFFLFSPEFIEMNLKHSKQQGKK